MGAGGGGGGVGGGGGEGGDNEDDERGILSLFLYLKVGIGSERISLIKYLIGCDKQ